jgi:hypothetical protein
MNGRSGRRRPGKICPGSTRPPGDEPTTALLLSLSRECGKAGSTLVLITSEQVDKMLLLSGLTQVFATAADMEQAFLIVEPPTS